MRYGGIWLLLTHQGKMRPTTAAARVLALPEFALAESEAVETVASTLGFGLRPTGAWEGEKEVVSSRWQITKWVQHKHSAPESLGYFWMILLDIYFGQLVLAEVSHRQDPGLSCQHCEISSRIRLCSLVDARSSHDVRGREQKGVENWLNMYTY